MDRKIRIHFFPRDASRVRIISFSHNLGLGILFTSVPLCLLGFWLLLTGSLREKHARKIERIQEERENRALGEKVGHLQSESETLLSSLDSLESIRIKAQLATGLEGPESQTSSTRSGLFRFFHSFEPVNTVDLTSAIRQARQAAQFFDSSLFILSRNRELSSELPTAYPVDPHALVIRPFGSNPDPFTGRRSLHAGVDFSYKPGSPVYAAGGGTVVATGQDPLMGIFIRLRHTDRAETFYAHLQKSKVRVGETVIRGQVIGNLGQTGVATGPHLHFELSLLDERVDPLPYLLGAEESGLAAR